MGISGAEHFFCASCQNEQVLQVSKFVLAPLFRSIVLVFVLLSRRNKRIIAVKECFCFKNVVMPG